MSVDMFLKLEKIKGESTDDKHKEEIDVLAWSWGASQSGSFHTGGGGGAGKANFQDLSFTKWVDKSSTVLLQHVAKGTHIPKGKLTVRKAGGEKPLEYLTINLEKIMVTSVSTGGSGGEDKLTENVTLNFARVEVVYKEQDESGGQKGGDVLFKWNIATNAEK